MKLFLPVVVVVVVVDVVVVVVVVDVVVWLCGCVVVVKGNCFPAGQSQNCSCLL